MEQIVARSGMAPQIHHGDFIDLTDDGAAASADMPSGSKDKMQDLRQVQHIRIHARVQTRNGATKRGHLGSPRNNLFRNKNFANAIAQIVMSGGSELNRNNHVNVGTSTDGPYCQGVSPVIPKHSTAAPAACTKKSKKLTLAGPLRRPQTEDRLNTESEDLAIVEQTHHRCLNAHSQQSTSQNTRVQTISSVCNYLQKLAAIQKKQANYRGVDWCKVSIGNSNSPQDYYSHNNSFRGFTAREMQQGLCLESLKRGISELYSDIKEHRNTVCELDKIIEAQRIEEEINNITNLNNSDFEAEFPAAPNIETVLYTLQHVLTHLKRIEEPIAPPYAAMTMIQTGLTMIKKWSLQQMMNHVEPLKKRKSGISESSAPNKLQTECHKDKEEVLDSDLFILKKVDILNEDHSVQSTKRVMSTRASRNGKRKRYA